MQGVFPPKFCGIFALGWEWRHRPARCFCPPPQRFFSPAKIFLPQKVAKQTNTCKRVDHLTRPALYNIQHMIHSAFPVPLYICIAQYLTTRSLGGPMSPDFRELIISAVFCQFSGYFVTNRQTDSVMLGVGCFPFQLRRSSQTSYQSVHLYRILIKLCTW